MKWHGGEKGGGRGAVRKTRGPGEQRKREKGNEGQERFSGLIQGVNGNIYRFEHLTTGVGKEDEGKGKIRG